MQSLEFKVGAVWRTRGGHKARILATDLRSTVHPLVVAVGTLDVDSEGVHCYRANGSYMREDDDSYLDLVTPWREPLEIEQWILVCVEEHIEGPGIRRMPGETIVAAGGWAEEGAKRCHANAAYPHCWEVVKLTGKTKG